MQRSKFNKFDVAKKVVFLDITYALLQSNIIKN